MKISFVLPAFRASATIGRALRSIFDPGGGLPRDWRLEVIVVDDGSPDREQLVAVLAEFPQARFVRHDVNLGMCASRNTGIRQSGGDFVVILDADDELVASWPEAFSKVLAEWPDDAAVCYAACRNASGEIAASEPDFRGYLTRDDILNERHGGEYLPIFRGGYIRDRGYVDLAMRRSCGVVSYLRLAADGPFWVSPIVLRLYDDRRDDSVSSNWTDRDKAAEAVCCYRQMLERFGDLYRERAPTVLRTKMLRLAVYLRLSGQPGAWRAWGAGVGGKTLLHAVATLLLLVLQRDLIAWLVTRAKDCGVIRRYG